MKTEFSVYIDFKVIIFWLGGPDGWLIDLMKELLLLNVYRWLIDWSFHWQIASWFVYR